MPDSARPASRASMSANIAPAVAPSSSLPSGRRLAEGVKDVSVTDSYCNRRGARNLPCPANSKRMSIGTAIDCIQPRYPGHLRFKGRPMKYKSLVASVFVVALLTVSSAAQPYAGYRPQNGFVPNEETALKIATAVLLPVYGDKLVLSPDAFKVSLKKDSWTVQGRLNCAVPECAGDVVEVEVARH